MTAVTQHFSEKDAGSGFPVSQGSAEALVRDGCRLAGSIIF